MCQALLNVVLGAAKKGGGGEEEMEEDGADKKAPVGFANNIYCTSIDPTFSLKFKATLVNVFHFFPQITVARTLNGSIYTQK